MLEEVSYDGAGAFRSWASALVAQSATAST
jgi:hypothetical protein